VSGRDEVLRRIRRQLRGGEGVEDVRAVVPYRVAGSLEPRPRLERFVDRVTEYRVRVHRSDSATLPDVIASCLAERGAACAVIPPDAPPAWRVPGIRWIEDGASGMDGASAVADPLPVATLDGADAVVTGCALAIADTGTVVLDTGALQGRRVLSLVPDYHLCVVRAEQVVETVPEAVRRLEPAVRAGLPLTFVSGPSATSDIELNRVEGVHGPRTLHVVVVS
jgi:L-lactate dehydrogenase complex protein LldG